VFIPCPISSINRYDDSPFDDLWLTGEANAAVFRWVEIATAVVVMNNYGKGVMTLRGG
jgi:hypothetical protein